MSTSSPKSLFADSDQVGAGAHASLAPTLRGVLVVGSGLIGTSIALDATAAGIAVLLEDADPDAVGMATALGAGQPYATASPEQRACVDLIVLAVPVRVIAAFVQRYGDLHLNASITDVGSVKSQTVVEAELAAPLLARWCPGHPMAGRERSGAAAAQPGLFRGRPWILTPTPATSALALERAARLVTVCGASVMQRDPTEHDRAVATVSHTPQLVASALAASLLRADPDDVVLAGQGLRDTTRLADSDPALWLGILELNAEQVQRSLVRVQEVLSLASSALGELRSDDPDVAQQARAALLGVLRSGNEGRTRIPGKHGDRVNKFDVIAIVVADRPGELGRVFSSCADAQINVEDLRMEHSQGHPAGIVEISVAAGTGVHVASALKELGWTTTLL